MRRWLIACAIAALVSAARVPQAVSQQDPVEVELSRRFDMAAGALAAARYSEAQLRYRALVDALTTALGASHELTLTAQYYLAVSYSSGGEYAASMRELREVLDELNQTVGGRTRLTMVTRHAIAIALVAMGRFDEADSELRQLINDETELLGSHDAETVNAYNTWAGVLLELGRSEEALGVYRVVRVFYDGAYGPSDSLTLSARNNIARALERSGDYARAAQEYRDIASILTQRFGRNSPATLGVRHNLAEVDLAMGHYAAAERELHEVLEAQAESLGINHPETIAALLSLASCDFALERKIAAAVRWSAWIDLESRLVNVNGVSEASLRGLTRASLGDAAILSAALLGPHPPVARVAAASQVVRHGRAGESFRATLASARAEGGSNEVASLQQALAEQAALEQRRDSVDADQRRAAQQRVDDAWSALAAVSPEARAIIRPALETLDAVSARLGERDALLHFARFQPIHPEAVGLAQHGPERYLAFVLRHGESAPTFVDLGPADSLDAMVEAVRAPLTERGGDVLTASRRLHERLFAPLRPLLGDARRVYVVFDGPLAGVPLALLVSRLGPDGVPRYLIDEGYRFLTLSSARELVRPVPPASSAPALVLAPFADGGERALPATAAEARAVATRLHVTPRLGAEAGYAALAQRGHAPRVLHLATHGYADDVRWNGSPLQFVGLDFGPDADDPDQHVSASRLAVELDLRGTELVVLSACETGLGAQQPGQDVASTRQAFHIAGARNVVASLWPVDDDASAFFMRVFYDSVEDGASVEDAYHRALLATRDHRASPEERAHGAPPRPFDHPRHWAPFTLSVVPGAE